MKIAAIMLVAALMPLSAQQIQMPANLENLAAKADQTVDVTLSGAMLQLAGRFASGKSEAEARTRKIISHLESITVKSFEFSRAGEYDPADVAAIRRQVQQAPWSRIVGVTSKGSGENVDVYFKDAGNGILGGIVVLCAEPKELTIVSIAGALDPADLADLGGQFSIPKLDVGLNIHGKKEPR